MIDAEPRNGAEAEAQVRESLVALAAIKRHRLHPDMLSRPLTVPQAQAIYRNLMRCPDKEVVVTTATPEPPAAPRSSWVPQAERVTEDGIYLHDGKLYKSLINVGTDRRFAKVLDPKTGEWSYAKGAMAYLRQAEKITVAQAIEFGRQFSTDPDLALYGRCFMCGRPLSNQESIDLGIGPICRDSL